MNLVDVLLKHCLRVELFRSSVSSLGFNRDIRLPSPMDQDHAAALQQLIRSETHISPYEKLFEVCIFYYLGIASAILKDRYDSVIYFLGITVSY